MRTAGFVTVVTILLSVTGCSEKHLITSKSYRETVDNRFAEKEKIAANRKAELFDIFNKNLSLRQTEALKFLFAFMPLNDLADHSGGFFLANADIALESVDKSPWGKTIPEDIFLHYVLPPRVNNENLDSFRIVCKDEIKKRISGLSLSEAALEINHWCHEKVTYQSSDIRTSGPMSTILSARGRCGEESTFTVSALRAAGIPARQVYTPRWAHTDDNHAWVEIWDNGNWYYMGACEPEAQLDHGWFTEPARRAMLIHTKSFGAPYGNENTISCHKDYCEINCLAKYAVTKLLTVRVTDLQGLPVKEAAVEFQPYNYAEFYPLTRINTDSAGICRFETGLGDLLVWARKDDLFNYKKISVGEKDTVLIQLGISLPASRSETYDLKAPVSRTPLKGLSGELVEKNSKRLENENSIREHYIKSWISPEEAERFAVSLDLDTAPVKKVLAAAMGNYKTIKAFLKANAAENHEMALSLLNVISEKDLRDTRPWILEDHIKNITNPFGLDTKSELFTKYVLNPRIGNEILTPYRGYLREALTSEFRSNSLKDPSYVVKYINESVRILNEENFYGTPLTPIGVYELKSSDSGSRDIYFVAICRSLGIPSRLEPGSNKPQYYFNSGWKDVFFGNEEQAEKSKGFLKIFSNDKNPVPEYYTHFTIAKFESGRYNTLEYDYNKRITDFKDELTLSPGHYMLVTGNRPDDNRVLAGITFFDLALGEHKTFEVKIRKESAPQEFYGKIDIGKLSAWLKKRNVQTEPDFNRGTVIAIIDPEKEPGKHVLNDLPLLKTEFDARGISFILIFSDSTFNLNKSTLKGLPDTSVQILETDLNKIGPDLQIDVISTGDLPLLIAADKNGNILFRSSGYRIGIGEQILKKF